MAQIGYRERCLAQKINACNVCGTDEKLLVHHINGDRDDDRLENLVPVCGSCHASIHMAPDPSGPIAHLQDKLPESSIRDAGWIDGPTASPSVRMSKGLDRRLNIAAAHENMNKTAFIRQILEASIGPIEDEGFDAFVRRVESGEGQESEEIEV